MKWSTKYVYTLEPVFSHILNFNDLLSMDYSSVKQAFR